MGNIITPVLPHDLPENWNDTQYVSPGGTEVGLTEKHGYNYLMKQVNNSQKAINELDAEMKDIDTTLQNKAPAGYGLGTNAVPIDDYNNAVNNGWYRGGTNYPSKISYANYGMVRVDSVGQIKFQTFYAGDTGGAMTSPLMAIRKSIDSGATWSEWEYVNPPFIKDVVYRTTDRHLGNPVYKKMDSNGVIWWSTDQKNWKVESERFGFSESKVMAIGSLTAEKVHLAASELVSYIESLPKMLNKQYQIYVASGTIEETVIIDGFYGPGRLWIETEWDPETDIDLVVLKGGVRIGWCSAQIVLKRLRFTGTVLSESFVEAYASPIVFIHDCTIDGTGTSGKIGVHSNVESNVAINTCTLRNLYRAVQITALSKASLVDVTASGISVGVTVFRGGIAMLCGSTPDLVGGSSNSKQGGIIVKSDGTLL